MGIDGGRGAAAHLDTCNGRDVGIGVVADARNGSGKSKAAAYLKT